MAGPDDVLSLVAEPFELMMEPFGSSFMVRAAVGVVALGVAGPLCGCWVTQRRLVYLADAMSHAILAGVAAAALLGVSLLAGAFAAAVVMALGVALLVLRAGLAEDSAIGVTGQGLFALGVIGVTFNRDDPRALAHVLFGNPLTVTWPETWLQLGLAAVVVAAAWLLLPVLTATTFDQAHARTVGIRVAVVETWLVVGLGLVVVIGLTTVGVLMAVAMVVIPPATARLVTERMPATLAVAAGLGVGAGLAGLIASYHLALPTGPTIAMAAVAQLAAVALVRRRPGRVARRVVTRGDHPRAAQQLR